MTLTAMVRTRALPPSSAGAWWGGRRLRTREEPGDPSADGPAVPVLRSCRGPCNCRGCGAATASVHAHRRGGGGRRRGVAGTGGAVWGVEVDLDLIRKWAGDAFEAELSRFKERGNGNVLWVGRAAEAEHHTIQLTLQDGYLVGWCSLPFGRQFEVRAHPGGTGRVVTPGPETRVPSAEWTTSTFRFTERRQRASREWNGKPGTKSGDGE